MPVISIPSSNECHFMKSLLQHFTPSPSPKQQKQQSQRLSVKGKATIPGKISRNPVTPSPAIMTTTTTAMVTANSCRHCLHVYTQLNSLRQRLRSAHAAYAASQCQDERTFAHIPMLTVRSYRPNRRRQFRNGLGNGGGGGGGNGVVEGVDPVMSSLKLEIRRNEPVNALFMVDDKWVYVKTSDERRGFIPAKCCQPFALALHALNHAGHCCNTATNVKLSFFFVVDTLLLKRFRIHFFPYIFRNTS